MTYQVSSSSSYPHLAVVRIVATFSNGSQASGSGVVVGQNDVLTAAHVIYDGILGAATNVSVTPGQNGSSSAPVGTSNASLWNYYQVDTDGDGFLSVTESGYDFAILGFNTKISSSTGTFGIQTSYSGGSAYVTGYPGVYGSVYMMEDFGSVSSGFSNTLNISNLEVNSGNSGGPIWYYVNGLPYVGGIVSTSASAGNVTGTYQSQIEAWISGNDTLLSSSDTVITGTDSADQIIGASSNDAITGYYGEDTISGGIGNDVIYGNHNIDLIFGNDGSDTIFGGQNNGTPRLDAFGNLRMQDGIETISGGGGADVIYGNFGSETINGGSGNDILYGGQNEDTINGSSGDDTIFGNRDNDTLSGSSGDDRLYGNGGDDDLIGGSGADYFTFTDISDSDNADNVTSQEMDSISDFSILEGDKIDLSAIDGDTATAGHQSLTYGTGFNQARAWVSEGNTYILVDTDGVGNYDMMIEVLGVTTMTASDFVF